MGEAGVKKFIMKENLHETKIICFFIPRKFFNIFFKKYLKVFFIIFEIL